MNLKVITIGYNWINTCVVDHRTGKHPFPALYVCLREKYLFISNKANENVLGK